jgi:lysophospholipase L1-like esterase
MNRRSIILNVLIFSGIFSLFLAIYINQRGRNHFYKASDKRFHYTGRFDFSEEDAAKAWAPGAYIEFKFVGTYCDLVIEDEYRHFNKHNYIVIVLDNEKPKRIRLTDYYNQIKIGKGLKKGKHTVRIVKATESYFGYIKLVGVWCKDLVKFKKTRKLLFEFIGDSITCGSGNDKETDDASGNAWSDLENAYVAFGPLLARRYNASWILSAVSGIGLTNSFTESDKNMPEMYPRISLDEHAGKWDFKSQQQPDIIVITLGQNDGLQKEEKYISAYKKFISFLRSKFPKSILVCSNSPMSEPKLRLHLNKCIQSMVSSLRKSGMKNIYAFYYKKKYNSGHTKHPSKSEHLQMVGELQSFFIQRGWKTEQDLLDLRKMK